MPRKQHDYHFIYKTVNLVNEKFYIGMHSTSNLEDGYIGSGKKLWYSINKYGRENFKMEILEFLPDRNSLKEREREIVNSDLLKEELCMNLAIGGEGGNTNTPENSRNNMKKVNEILWKNEDFRNRKIDALNELRIKLIEENKFKFPSFKGFSHSQETRDKIGEKNSNLQKGNKNSQFGTCWITNGIENKKIKKNTQIPEGWKFGRK